MYVQCRGPHLKACHNSRVVQETLPLGGERKIFVWVKEKIDIEK